MTPARRHRRPAAAHRSEPLPSGLAEQIDRGLRSLERKTGRAFAGDGLPLMVSVRSGAKVSMPGMMDTILNLGLDAGSIKALIEVSGDRRFAVDSWTCFWNMYADIVLGLDPTLLAESLDEAVAGAVDANTADGLPGLEKAIVAAIEAAGESAPTDPRIQLDKAIAAVFDSWDSRRARTYREHHGIADDLGTAVVVQAMVFGNLDAKSGSGVAFTRNPIDGARVLFGEYVVGRQGEELVSGTTTPISLADPGAVTAELKTELERFGEILEKLYRDALDIEFTVESGRLYLLQVRPAKRTAEAAVRIATELADAGVISRRAALTRVTVDQIKRLLRPEFDLEARARADREGAAIAKGIGASPGHATGFAVLDADRAAERAAAGERIILVRPTTSPQDVRGMLAAEGVVTARGGSASHAAVVSRALDKPCVVGCRELAIDTEQRTFQAGGRDYPEGSALSIDGQTGDVYATEIPLAGADKQLPTLSHLLEWADDESAASIWMPVHNSQEVAALSWRRPEGLAVIAVTDVLISHGAVGGLIEAITELSADEGAPASAVEDRFEQATYDACRALFESARELPVDLRLPNLSSARAQRMVSEWASLTPHLLLPLGSSRMVEAMLRAIGSAAADAGHGNVTPIISGITDRSELLAFAEIAERTARLRVGALLGNPAVVFSAAELLDDGPVIWVDLHELIRSAHGYPEVLLYSDEAFEEYVAAGRLARHPRASLDPLVRQLLANLLEAADKRTGIRVGADLGGAPVITVIGDVYKVGFRRFTSPPQQWESIRLLLGQSSIGDPGHD